MGLRIDRRAFLRLGRDLGLLALLPGELLAQVVEHSRAGGAGLFLSAPRLRTLGALCAHFIPGPPEDPDPGALEAGAPEYIDLLLAAFEVPLPPIFAGGPFSNREAGGKNFFAEFLALDALEERVWRTRIEGSRGLPEREWNGPVVGLQERYASGLDELDAHARRWLRAPFHELARWRKDLLLWWAPDELEAFVELAFVHTVEGTYGAPEYAGNRGRVGWRYTRWPGDVQPHGYSDAEISQPDPEERRAVESARARARDARRRPVRLA